VVLHEDHEMIPLIINSIRQDLEHHNEYFICLALAAVCNIGGKGMAEALAPSVEKLLISTCVYYIFLLLVTALTQLY